MSFEEYQNKKITLMEYLKIHLEEIKPKDAQIEERVLALIGSFNDAKNLCYVVGRMFGNKAFTGALYTPGSLTFREGLKEFEHGKVRVFKGDVLPDASKLFNKGIGRLLKLIEED
ncbi:hypothetical protein GF352_03890 [archaeon]|nr:hypothetical protein [archaeon]